MLGVTHVAIQFPLYEYLKVQLAARGGGRSPDQLTPGVSSIPLPPAVRRSGGLSKHKHAAVLIDVLLPSPASDTPGC